MEEWKEYKLGEVVRLINGRAYAQHELFDDGKYRIVRVGNLSGGDRWFYSDMELSEEKYCEKGDLLYAWACNFGPYIWKGDKTIYHYHIWKLVEDKNVVDKLFLFYYLKHLTPYWLGNVNGSVMVHITKGTMEKFLIPLPSLTTQRRIAIILKSLDDKIEVNMRINDNLNLRLFQEAMLLWTVGMLKNDNLEQQAQTLFRSWFMDFEPFKDGEFEESELGMIPKGWRVGTLGELIDIKYGKDHKKMKNGEIPVYGSGGLMRMVEKPLYEGESVLIPRKGTLNNVLYVNESFWTVDTMFYSIPKIKSIVLYVYLFLRGKDLASMNAGSAVPSMTTEILNKMNIVIPTSNILYKFNTIVSSAYNLMKQNKVESYNLTHIRDNILPNLMSGDLTPVI